MALPDGPVRAAAGGGLTPAAREKRRVALVSIIAAVGLTAAKLVVGLLTGSLGLLAEAAHSGLDLVAAVITYLAVRVSDRPADSEHHYGHGKIENLSALVQVLLLLGACGWIVLEAVERLRFQTVHVEATAWAFLVIAGSIVVDFSRSRALGRAARKHGSQALEADALHFRTDIWSSAVVLLGLALVRAGAHTPHAAGFQRADAVAALIVALLVIYVSVRLGGRTIDALLDRAPAGLATAVTRAVRAVDGVLACRRVRLRSAGNRTFIDLVIGVARGLSLERSHAIAEAAEQRIRALLPRADVVVHVEPQRGAGETLAERIRAIAVNAGHTVHNVLVSEEAGRLHVELHLETDADLELREAHDQADRLEATISAELPGVTSVTTHIEPHRDGPQRRPDVTAGSAALLQEVRRIVDQTPGVVACHDLTVRRAGRDVFLTMHCTFAAGLAVRDVHEISTRLENRLRAAIPNLVRVTTHAEPVGEPPGPAGR